MDILCPDEWEKYDELFEDWQEAYDAIGELRETQLMLMATMDATCIGAVATVETVVGGVVGGFGCLIATWAFIDASDDVDDAIVAANKKAARFIAQAKAYSDCVADHKSDP